MALIEFLIHRSIASLIDQTQSSLTINVQESNSSAMVPNFAKSE